MTTGAAPTDTRVGLAPDVTLAVRQRFPDDGASAAAGTVVLVHGLASNALTWDGVADHLARLGYASLAVDARGHGSSPDTADGYDTDTAAADLAALLARLGPRGPVVAAGQSWGGNVVLTLAARHAGAVDGIALLDGGWLRIDGDRPFDEVWEVMAPPRWGDTTWAQVVTAIRSAHPDWSEDGIAATLANLTVDEAGRVRNRLALEHHRSIFRSIYDGDPRGLYPLVEVPALLMPAGTQETPMRSRLGEAVDGLSQAVLRPYDGADHDLHVQHPDRVASDLAELAASLPRPPVDGAPAPARRGTGGPLP